MHCNSILRKYALLLAVPMFLYSACTPVSDNTLTNSDDNGGYASDASKIEWINDDVISLGDAAGLIYNGAYMRTTKTTIDGTCATVATDTTTGGGVNTIIIRFGQSGTGSNNNPVDCNCLDGRNRRGSIIIQYSGHYFDSGTVHTFTFNNYFVNDVQVSGTIQTIIADTTVTGNHHYSVYASDSINVSTTAQPNQFIVWNGSFDRKWISGETTPGRGDDGFLVSGSGTLTRANGHQFSFAISSPLQVYNNCNYIEAGIVTVTGSAGSRILNYGSGGCDANASVSVSGTNVYNFTLTP